MTTYYKAVRMNGTDFFSGAVRWVPEDGVIPPEGWRVEHPTATTIGPEANEYLSVSTVATDCTSMDWPCRLLAVEAVGDVSAPDPGRMPNKCASVVWRVVGELPAHEALGPQGVEVAEIIDRAGRLTPDETRALITAWNAAWDTSWDTAWNTAWYSAWSYARSAAWDATGDVARDAALRGAVWDAARNPVRFAARDAAWATMVRDLVKPEVYNLLIGPWRSVMGEETSS